MGPRKTSGIQKNKPKPPIIITRDNTNAMRTHMMEVENACDIVEIVSEFARKRRRRVFILSGTKTVTNVTLEQPASLGLEDEDPGVAQSLLMRGGNSTTPLFHGLPPNLSKFCSNVI
uniref:DNA-binding protein ESCAROLA n=1 Tax=Cajanus cajan TaxID=3821 RepID=A0A151SEF6_CAJCA|nr:Putative DNA-binding protein ESCAROLA [Cajanus cajan]